MTTKIIFAKTKKPWLHEMLDSLNDHPWAINLNSQLVGLQLPPPDDIVFNEAQLGCKWTVARESSIFCLYIDGKVNWGLQSLGTDRFDQISVTVATSMILGK